MIRILGAREKKKNILCVVGEPDGGEMAPAELADDGVSAFGKGVTDLDGVVSAFDIVLPVFLVLCHDGSRVRRIGTVGHPRSTAAR